MTPRPEQLLVVGAGMAAGRLVERLVERGYPGEITLAGDEPEAAYNRVLLPGFVAGSCDAAALCTHPDAWFHQRRVRTVLGRPVRRLSVDDRVAELEDGTRLHWDRLVLATGATAPIPDIPGAGLDGVTTLRNLRDARRLQARIALLRRSRPKQPVRAVVVGGGLLGLETAQSLLEVDVRVWVVHRNRRLLNRQLDGTASAMLAGALERRGMNLLLGASPQAVLGRDSARAVDLDGAATVPADLVVFATGTQPNDHLAAAAGIRCDGGVLVDGHMTGSHPDVHALGECARIGGTAYALVEPVYRQADVLARVLCGEPSARFRPPPPATRLKVSGIELFSAGRVPEADGGEQICIHDPGRGLYRRLAFDGDRLTGAVLLGDIAGSQPIAALIDAGGAAPADATARTRLAFGLEPTAAQS